MNILKEIQFDSEKPAVLRLYKSNHINFIAIGLLENQILKKHQTAIPTLLTVLKGGIEFRIKDEKLRFAEFDTFQIPINTLHEVEGLAQENIFTLNQDKI